MNRHQYLRPRPLGRKIKPRSQETNRHNSRDETLAQIMPVKGKACIDSPKYRKAEPDGRGAHLEENSTTQTGSALPLRSDHRPT